MSSVKKVSYVDVGGCGGSVYRSQRRAGLAVPVQYQISPQYPSGCTVSIRRLKKGTVGVWLTVESWEMDDVEEAKKLIQEFDNFIQNPEYTDKEQEVLDAAEELRLSVIRGRWNDALDTVIKPVKV
jgi:hypothetical protein